MRSSALALLSLLAVACGGDTPPADAPAADAPPAEQPADGKADGKADAKGDHGDHGDAAGAHAFVAATEGAKVSFGSPADGATLKSPVSFTFEVEGMTVKPAGTMEAGTGHHHIIINGQPVAAGEVVPADDTHIHFGKGQTETTLELPPGEHTLTLQFADGMHRSYGPDLTSSITVTIE